MKAKIKACCLDQIAVFMSKNQEIVTFMLYDLGGVFLKTTEIIVFKEIFSVKINLIAMHSY